MRAHRGSKADAGATLRAGPAATLLPEIDSCVELFPTAEFQEREAYDFFGIVFSGHPDLTRILLPDDYVGWPQRRDFPVGGEPVPSPTTSAIMAELLGGHAPTEVMTVNIGPHHPATHGVLRLIVDLEGEVVRDLKPVIGYVHTGIEKSCEDKSYWKVIPFVERMDYVSYFFQMEAFCGAVERLVELEIPPRAKYLRTIFLELNRIHSHLVWLGTTALDLGAISMLWYCFRERDRILDLFEMATGQRMHTRYFQVGGVIEDIPLGFEAKLREFVADMPVRVGQYQALLDRNEVFLSRTKGVGIVSRERLLELGVTGPLLRAAGEPWDLRKAFDYLAYPEMDFKIPVGTVGDNYDRYRVRVAEMVESMRIVEQALDGLPEGPFIADDRKYVLPPRSELSTSMESLIHHFKLVTEGYRVAPGEVYYAIESPRGELGCFVLADGSSKPARVHFRDPSFVNLQAFRDMAIDGYIADMICQPRDARPDPRRGGSMSPVDGARQRRPGPPGRRGADRGARPRPRPRGDPRAARGRLPGGAARADRRADGPLPGPQLGLDPGALGGAAALRLVHAGGDPPGRRGDAGDAGLPGVGRQLLRPAPHRAGRHPQGRGLHQHQLLDAGRRRAARRLPRPRPRARTTSSSPASSASAPATSRRWPRSTSATSGRWRRPRRRRRSSS